MAEGAAPKLDMAARSELFMKITTDHQDCDVVVACRARLDWQGAGIVEFFCHRCVLEQHCAVFADAAEFRTLSQGSQVTDGDDTRKVVQETRCRMDFLADDDIVFEVLRYVYLGALYFPIGFRVRFSQFLATVDFFGIEDMAERAKSQGNHAIRSIFEEPGVEQWIRNLPMEDILTFLQDDSIVGDPAASSGVVGFNLRRGFLLRLVELRPQDLVADVLGIQLYWRLTLFGRPAMPVEQKVALATSNRLLLPGSVIFTGLSTGGVAKCVNMGAFEPILQHPDAVQQGSGRYWYNGRLLETSATRASLLRDDDPPHAKIVLLYESVLGQEVFDTSLHRAEARGVLQGKSYLMSLASLLDSARRTDSGKCGPDHVEVVYSDPHEAEGDLMLVQDVNHQGALTNLVISGLQPGGPAERAGVAASWVLAKKPDGLSVHAPPPGLAGDGPPFVSCMWKSLSNMVATLSSVSHSDLEVVFTSRPFGFSWSLAGGTIVIHEVKRGGSAMQHQVQPGMVLQSMHLNPESGSTSALTDTTAIIEALRGTERSALLRFAWPETLRSVQASVLAGVKFEEWDLPAGVGQKPAKGVFIASIPFGHRARSFCFGRGWQLTGLASLLRTGSTKETPITSLEQLPRELREPQVTLEFTPSLFLQTGWPLEMPAFEPQLKLQAVREALPWCELEERKLGPLWRVRCRSQTTSGAASSFNEPGRDVEGALGSADIAGGGSSSSSSGSARCSRGSADGNEVDEANEDDDDLVIEAVALSILPPSSRMADLLIRRAGPHEGLLWELRLALEAVARETRSALSQPLVAAALRKRRGRGESMAAGAQSSISDKSAVDTTSEDDSDDGRLRRLEEEGWLGGIVLGESLAQILFRWAMHAQATAV